MLCFQAVSVLESWCPPGSRRLGRDLLRQSTWPKRSLFTDKSGPLLRKAAKTLWHWHWRAMEESKSNVNLARVYPESFILHLALLNCMRSPFCTYIQATKLPRLIRFVFFCLRCQVGWSISRHKNHYVFAGKAATLGMLRWTFGAHFWSGRWCEENRPAPLCALTSRCDLMMVKDGWGEFSHCSLLVTGQWWSAKY